MTDETEADRLHHKCTDLRHQLEQLRCNYRALAADVLGIESMSTVEWEELRERCKAVLK